MALKISSWVKSSSKELIPIYMKYKTLVFDYDVDLGLCWEYIDENFHCCCLEPKSDNTAENYMYNLFNFKILFLKKKTDLLVNLTKW